MKPFHARTIFIFSSNSFPKNPFSSCHSLHLSHLFSSSNHHVEESKNVEGRNVRVSVWWDFENCSPSDGNIFKIYHNITTAIRTSGIKGPIQITAFGDINQLSSTNQEALYFTGIRLNHIPHGGKHSAKVLDLMYWASENRPPLHIFLISGNKDFSKTLHRLKMKTYNILLACPENYPIVLRSPASIMWDWNSILKGDNLTGKYFNQSIVFSCYGYIKVPLENPYAVDQQPSSSCTQSEDLSDSCQEQKVRPIPKVVVRQIRRILSNYPKGIRITDLQAELSKDEINFDMYGYKKFSRFLLAMPHINLFGSDGCINVGIVPSKLCEPAKGPSVSNSEDLNVCTKGNGNDNKLSISPELPKKMQIEQIEVEPTKEEVDINAFYNKLYIKEEIDSQSELRFLEKLQRKKMGYNEENSCEGSRANLIVEETDGRSMNQAIAHLPGLASSSLSDNGKTKAVKVFEPEFFKKFIDWFKFWRTDEDACKIPKEVVVDDNQVKNKKFSSDTFWTEMKRFLDTSHGLEIVLRSRNREDIAEKLQKEGPSILTSLSTSDLLHLLHLMIAEKKWVQEHISQPYPFKLVKPVKHSSRNESESDHIINQKQNNILKSSEIPKNYVLADCQKLADEIVNDYPDGFHIRSFRRLFVQRFGYPLDFQKLGYQKLKTLLQIMPGVKVESNFIYPSTKNANGHELSDS